jgi:hypothetical protein
VGARRLLGTLGDTRIGKVLLPAWRSCVRIPWSAGRLSLSAAAVEDGRPTFVVVLRTNMAIDFGCGPKQTRRPLSHKPRTVGMGTGRSNRYRRYLVDAISRRWLTMAPGVSPNPRFESDAIGSASLPASGRAPQPER